MSNQALDGAAAPGGWAVAADVAIVVISVAVVLLTLMVLLVLRRIDRVLGEVAGEVLRSLREEIQPLAANALGIAKNTEAVTGSLRGGAQHLADSAEFVSGGAKRAWAGLEERVVELTALLAVIQEEFEELYLSTASTLRTLKLGARLVSAPGRARSGGEAPGAEGAADGAVADDAEPAAVGDETEEEPEAEPDPDTGSAGENDE